MPNIFFESKSILGLQPQIIKSDDSYNIVLIGTSSLATKILYKLAILSNLPEQNRLNLYLVDKKAKKFYKKLQKNFSGIEKVPHLNIKTIKLDSRNPQFYTNKIWEKENLTNVIIATKDEKKNLEIKDILKNHISTQKTNILSINNSDLKNKISKLEAKLIYHLYKEVEYNPNLIFTKKNINDAKKRWKKEASKNDKKSSQMQSIHIDIKLLALGLKREKSTKTPEKLLEINKKVFDEKLGFKEITDKELQQYSKKLHNLPKNCKVPYFPKNYKSLFEKLIRAEHDRWNTYHYLNGWTYSKNKDKSTKKHDCLLPLDKFNNNKIKATIIFDIYALVYIPNILASLRVELVEVPD